MWHQMRAISFVAPLVLKVFNALIEVAKCKQLLGNKDTKALCKLNWDYALKKIMDIRGDTLM